LHQLVNAILTTIRWQEQEARNEKALTGNAAVLLIVRKSCQSFGHIVGAVTLTVGDQGDMGPPGGIDIDIPAAQAYGISYSEPQNFFSFYWASTAPTASSVLLAQGTEEMRFFRPMAVILRAIAAIQSTATSPSTSLMRVGPQASFLGRLVNSTIFTC
jgi:hypothetical protein